MLHSSCFSATYDKFSLWYSFLFCLQNVIYNLIGGLREVDMPTSQSICIWMGVLSRSPFFLPPIPTLYWWLLVLQSPQNLVLILLPCVDKSFTLLFGFRVSRYLLFL